MSKKNNSQNKNLENKKEVKTPKTPGKAPQTPAKSPAENKKPEETQVEDAHVLASAMNPETLIGSSKRRGGLSPDATVKALDLARRVFVEEKDPDLQFPKETAIKVNKIVAVGILCTLADHATNGADSFAAVLQTQAYPSLAAAAEEIGFKIPDIKALPVKDSQVQIAASQIEIPEETKKELKEEKNIREGEAPEMDPEKITSEDDLRAALKYLFVTSSKGRLAETLMDGIDFMKKFRLHEASLAENAEEAKAKFDRYNSGDWLDDLFTYVKPSVFFAGIGKGMASVTAVEKSPIHAFTIFRDAIKNKDTNEPVLDDQEIAYCVRSIIKWCCNINIESNEKAIENLDAKKNAKEIEVCNKQIEHYKDILNYITSVNADEIDDMIANIGSNFDEGGQLTPETQKANQTFNRICRTYYGKNLSTTDYKNLESNIQQYGYHIVNLFRGAGEQLMDCGLQNVSELEERSDEEKAALIKELKKAWAEKKKETKASETKNA